MCLSAHVNRAIPTEMGMNLHAEERAMCDQILNVNSVQECNNIFYFIFIFITIIIINIHGLPITLTRFINNNTKIGTIA